MGILMHEQWANVGTYIIGGNYGEDDPIDSIQRAPKRQSRFNKCLCTK